MKIKIRKAKLSDTPLLDELDDYLVDYHSKHLYTKDDEFYNQRKKNSGKIWKDYARKNIISPSSLILIAFDEDEPIGYCFALIKKNIPIYKIKKYAYISDIFVKKDYRGKGIAKKMFNQVMRFYKNKKIKFLELQVNHNNHKAIKFYQNYGFKEYHKTMRMRI